MVRLAGNLPNAKFQSDKDTVSHNRSNQNSLDQWCKTSVNSYVQDSGTLKLTSGYHVSTCVKQYQQMIEKTCQ